MSTFGVMLLVPIGMAIIVFPLFYYINGKLYDKSKKRRDAEFAEYENVAKEKVARFFKSLALKYPHLGEPSFEYCFDCCIDIETRKDGYWHHLVFNSIIVWEESRMFMLTENKYVDGEVCSEPMPFKMLLSYRKVNEDEIIRGYCQTITDVNKFGAFTRGAIGGLLFGYKGAVAGVLSSPTTTRTISEPDRIIRTYKIHLTLNNPQIPYVVLNFRQSEKQMRKVLSTLKKIKQKA